MNKPHIAFHLREALEELSRTILELEGEPEYCEGEFYVAMAHLYHHLNTAWNGRNVRNEEISILGQEEYGVVRVPQGKVTPAFLAEVEGLCREHAIAHAWVGAVPTGQRLRLVFSRAWPVPAQQRLRNLWDVVGWSGPRSGHAAERQRP